MDLVPETLLTLIAGLALVWHLLEPIPVGYELASPP